MMLIEMAPGSAPLRHRFPGDRVSVGRGLDNDVVVVEPAVSRRHAELRFERGHWVVEDLASRNGTLVNGRPLLGETEILRSGDHVSVGSRTFVLELRITGQDASSVHVAETAGEADAPLSAAGGVPPALVGRSLALAVVRDRVTKLARTNLTILVLGEPGTGKELVARLLHAQSKRAAGAFVPINCPAISRELFEAEIFGVKARGVATGVEPRVGRIRAAAGGTVFFDEIGDLAPDMQAKLLRFLEDGKIDPVGSHEPEAVDVRVVAATNRDLAAEVVAGRFRRDLHGRLDGAAIRLPGLSERSEDVPDLARYFLARLASPVRGFTPEALEMLAARTYPGNIRELRRTVETAAALAEEGLIGPAHVEGLGVANASENIESLVQRLLNGEADFWEEVREPFLRRILPLASARRIVQRLHDEAGSYKHMAERMGIASQHRKLLSFLRDHALRVDDES